MAGPLQEKLIEMAREYLDWFNKFERSLCYGTYARGYARVDKPCHKSGKIIMCAPPKCPDWCDRPQNFCDADGIKGASGMCRQFNEAWQGWRKVLRMRETLAKLLRMRSQVSLLEVAVNASSSTHAAAAEAFRAKGPLAAEFLDHCGGLSCITGESTAEQRAAIRELAQRAAREALEGRAM